MGYETITLDYLYCYLSWDLTIRDLKQIALNGIHKGNFDDKEKLLEEFNKQWK